MNLEKMKKLGTKVWIGDKIVPVSTFVETLEKQGLSLGRDYRLCYAFSLKEAVDLCRKERGEISFDRVRELRFREVWILTKPEVKQRILRIFEE